MKNSSFDSGEYKIKLDYNNCIAFYDIYSSDIFYVAEYQDHK